MTPQPFTDRGADESLAPDEALVEQALSSDEFRTAFRNHAAGVALVTADDGSRPVAITATSVFSVSATPPLFVFSVSDLSSATPTIVNSESVVVHFLAADQLHLAQLGATSGIDRFADTSLWQRLPTGEAYFPGAPSWIRGVIVNRFEAGTSTLIVVKATHAGAYEADGRTEPAEQIEPLVYHNRTWHRLGSHSVVNP